MKYILLLITMIFTLGCDVKNELTSLNLVSDSKKVWVFSQFNVPDETDGMESYFYYGKVSESLLALIKNNQINSGFILLEEVKYWGDDDIIYDYKDIENTGELVFRIENLVKINIVDTTPIVGQGYEQYEETQLNKTNPDNLETISTVE